VTIWELIEDALEGLNLPMAENYFITETGEELPNEYMAYFLITSLPEQHADDQEKSRNYHVQINYYNRDGLAGMPDISDAMTTAGFTCGPTRELSYNQETRHFGLALEFWYYEEV